MIDWGSNVVNGQLVPQAPTSAFFPLTMGAQYRGPGMWPRQGTFQVPPVIPNAGMASQMSPNATGGGDTFASQTQARNAFHPTQGTVLFAFGALVLGLFMLRYIHYGK